MFRPMLIAAFLATALPAGAQEETVPFELVENIIIAKGTLNGRPATWIVDTGANGTVVTPKSARQCDVGGDKEGIAQTVGAGGALARDLTVAILDPSVAHFLRKSGVDYTGILGTTYLEQFLVTIDYGTKRLVFAPPDARPAAGNGVGFELKNRLIFVECRAGRETLRLVFDTGAQATVLRPRAAERAGIESRPIPGSADVRAGRIPALAVGEVVGRDVEIAVSEPPQADQLERAGISFDGFLGYTFLSRYRVTIDYKRKWIRLDPASPAAPAPDKSAPPAADDPRPPLGLDLNDTVVLGVDRGSAAEKAGFRVGDVITSIDGQEVRLIEEIRAILVGAKRGAALSVIAKRGRDKVTLKLVW